MQQSTRSFQCFKWNIRGSDNHLVLSGSSGGSGDTTSDGSGGGLLFNGYKEIKYSEINKEEQPGAKTVCGHSFSYM